MLDGLATEIYSVYDFYFLMQPWCQCRNLQDDLGMFSMSDWKEWWGADIAAAIYTNDPDTAAYLQSLGGVFIYAGCQLPDPKTVRFGINGDWKSYTPQPFMRLIGSWAKNYDAAMCRLAAIAKRLKKAEIEKARKLQGEE